MQSFAYVVRVISFLLLGLIASPSWADVVTYFHNDIAGTPMAATDASGNLLWKESYRPYGERLLNAASPNTNRLWYGGKPEDATTGLSYFGARYYNAQVGRFMGIDPKEVDPNDLHSFNRYAYANNNPYKFVDPDGRVAETAWDAINIGLGVSSLTGNLKTGNYSSAAIDAVGVIIDSVAAAIPLVPGGIGSILKVTREGAEVTAKVAAKAEDTVSIFKAPQRGKGADQYNNGYNVKDFCTGDQCAYFAKDRALAEDYAKHYGEGVIELQIPKSTYDARLKQYEYNYQGGPYKELPVPHSEFEVQNDAERIWHQ